MIFNEEMVSGRERVTTDEGRVLSTAKGLNRDQIVKIARLTGCKNFVSKRKKRYRTKEVQHQALNLLFVHSQTIYISHGANIPQFTINNIKRQSNYTFKCSIRRK